VSSPSSDSFRPAGAQTVTEVGQAVNVLAAALDDRDLAGWLACFMPDALVDFSAAGMRPCSPERFWELITAADGNRIGGQHLLGNSVVRCRGKQAARAHTEYAMTSLSVAASGRRVVTRVGGFYEDELVHTRVGWLFASRRAGVRWNTRDEIEDPAPSTH
jgi:3-phenylpropionate/cinnamic acid dioxygenase small subunit